MNLRRLLIAVTVLAGFAASIAVAKHTDASTVTRFSSVPLATRPYASHGSQITSTWYCPGVPESDNTVGGQIVVANPTDLAIQGNVTYVGTDGVAAVTQAITAPPRDKLTLDPGAVLKATFVSAVVELEGSEGMVEQQALTADGNAVASCTTQTSPTWYFADGWTAKDDRTQKSSIDQLIITNPTDDTVSIDVTFATKNGPRVPGAFQGDSIDPQSVEVINIADSGLVDETIIGVQVVATRGRLIVARAQHYLGAGRLGYSLDLGAPSPSQQVWFAEGDHGAGITEQYVIYNPTDTDTAVDAVVLGIPVIDGFVPPDSIPVPSGEVVTFDTATIQGLPDGPHSMVFSTNGGPSVVIERVLTKPAGDQVATSVVLGMTPEFAQASRWYVPIGVDASTDAAIVVYNPYQQDATVALKAIGPGGEVAVPGMDAITLPAAQIITIPLTDPSVFGKVLVVEASQGVYVERKLPRGGSLAGRSGSWALPECGPCSFSSPPSS